MDSIKEILLSKESGILFINLPDEVFQLKGGGVNPSRTSADSLSIDVSEMAWLLRHTT